MTGKKIVRVPRLRSLRVENYRALRSIELKDITPFTVLLGPNGSGKSTIFDVFTFLSDCFQNGLRHAWDRRGRGKELRSRGSEGPILIEFQYHDGTRLLTYHLAIDETAKGPVVAEEWLQWRRGGSGKPFRVIDYKLGVGRAVKGETLDEANAVREEIPLRSPEVLAVNTLGKLGEHPRVAALLEFITNWYVSYLSIQDAKSVPEAGPQAHLSRTGDNLANVIQYLKEQHEPTLERIFAILRSRVPRLEQVLADPMDDGRLLLQIKDAPFDRPILSKFASDGTLKMLSYLIVLHNPELPPFIGIEEPENFLHPRLLPELAEECRAASGNSQLLVTTHSPFFLTAMKPEEVRVLYRDEAGYTQAVRCSDIPGIPQHIAAGASLGHLWMEGAFGIGDPLVNHGAPKRPGKKG